MSDKIRVKIRYNGNDLGQTPSPMADSSIINSYRDKLTAKFNTASDVFDQHGLEVNGNMPSLNLAFGLMAEENIPAINQDLSTYDIVVEKDEPFDMDLMLD